MIQPGISQDSNYSTPATYRLQTPGHRPRGDFGLIMLLGFVMVLGFVITLAILYYFRN